MQQAAQYHLKDSIKEEIIYYSELMEGISLRLNQLQSCPRVIFAEAGLLSGGVSHRGARKISPMVGFGLEVQAGFLQASLSIGVLTAGGEKRNLFGVADSCVQIPVQYQHSS